MREHRLLMIPGPIEVEPAVLAALGAPSRSHVDPDFVTVMGRALARLREVMLAPAAQPFVLAGSGTLAMELAAANVLEAGEPALVVDTGYFGARMGAILERLGANVARVGAAAADAPSIEAVTVTV